VNLKAISCVQTDCVAVGQAGTWFASFDAGSQFRRVNEVGKFDAIQCSHAFRPTCVAGGMQDIGVSGSGGKLWSLPLSGNLGLDITSVNCTGPSECLFLGKTLTMYTTNLTSFGQRYAATTDPAGAKSTCITKDVCVGIAQGAVYTTLDGAVTPWTHNAFPGAATSMACLFGRMNPAVCLATTVEGFIVLGTMTQSAGDISWNWTTTDADASQALTAIGCSPGGQCTAVGVQGVVLASAGTNLMHWTERILPSIQTPVDQRPALASVTCPADGVCLAGGVNGDEAIIASTTNNWTDFSYDKIQGIEGAAATIKSFGCETVDRCVAVGSTSLIGVRKVLGGSSCVTCSGRLCPKSRLRTRANPQRRCPLYAS
jgi:hypothetical protein